MSSINSSGLKSATDPTISFITRPEVIDKDPIRHDSLLEYGMLIKTLKIVNNDALKPIRYKTQSPSNVYRNVDPLSSEELNEWTSYLEIVPDDTTGTGVLEMDLVQSAEAYQNGF